MCSFFYIITYTFKQKPRPADILPETQAPDYSLSVEIHNKALCQNNRFKRTQLFNPFFYTKTATDFYSNVLCMYIIVLANFNHRMYTSISFAADKTFIKRRFYVMLQDSDFRTLKNVCAETQQNSVIETTQCFLFKFIHSFIHSSICSESQVQIRQCVTQCEPNSKAQKRTLTAAFRLTNPKINAPNSPTKGG